MLLLGCGGVGTVIAKHLCRSGSIGALTVADVDGGLAERTAKGLPREKATAATLNAADTAAVRRALDGVGLVINAAMPRFNQTVQAAALEAGTDYLDLANDVSDPFTGVDAWRDAGRTALLGMGEDPGLSNVFARHAADTMDRIESIRVRDGDTASSPDHPFVALFSPETFVEETLNPSRIWREGAYTTVPPFGEPETYAFPAPIGPQRVYSVDHEEVDTLPRFIGKGVRYVDFKLALDDATVASLHLFRDLRLLERDGPDGVSPRKVLFSLIPKPADLVGKVDGNSAIVVEVVGERDGVRRTHTIHTALGHREAYDRFGTTATSYLTGTGAAIGAILWAERKTPAAGKLSPEQLDPAPVFPLLEAAGLEVRERVQVERPLN